MLNRTLVLGGIAVVVIVGGVLAFRSNSKPRPSTYTFQSLQPVDPALAAKAQDSCWFKVKNRSGRGEEVRQWQSASPVGAKTEKLGDLLIVTGALEQPVHDDRYYGCSLFEYTPGSPVVMTATSSPSPVRAGNVIPFGFSEDGKKQQR